ncbi:tail fiber assembly protein [Yersinia kristensenii]|uniref:tail fiber assembly protein n=1 Tax=Yersinia kristensenii TaxID=28152 RepID=UPI0005E6BED6|nr:tail fiber assembly protein [Yersinia kristensenii]CFR12379.1 putative phage tail fiber assembly protein [Yersinia kristensenii]
MKINILDSDGFYIVDHIDGELPPSWTSDLVGDGYYKAQYQSATKNTDTGEWTGGVWIETSGPTATDIEHAKAFHIAAANTEKSTLMSHASNMIDALSDEIEGLEEGGDDVPVQLRSDLKAWKQYRIAVKNINVSLAPDIEWPLPPE